MSWRDDAWERVSALAGVDPDTGQIVPPPAGVGIDLSSAHSWWRNDVRDFYAAVDSLTAPNPLFERLKYGYTKRETDKWLSGATDVSMGMTIETAYPGWPASG